MLGILSILLHLAGLRGTPCCIPALTKKHHIVFNNMSGFEALGMVSSVLQVISFAAQIAGLCKDIYAGRPTADDDVYRNATSMMDATAVMQSYCQCLGTSSADERSLADVAQKCNEVAQKLQKQVQDLASTKAGGNLSKSVGVALKSYFGKNKVESLEKALGDYRATMETHILVHIWSVASP